MYVLFYFILQTLWPCLKIIIPNHEGLCVRINKAFRQSAGVRAKVLNATISMAQLAMLDTHTGEKVDDSDFLIIELKFNDVCLFNQLAFTTVDNLVICDLIDKMCLVS